MAINQRQEFRQSQSLVMTPQLQQAIKLLQLSNLELSAYVESELEQNPLLEHEEGERGATENDASEGEAGETAEGGDDEVDAPDTATAVQEAVMPSAENSPLDTEYENTYTNGSEADRVNGDGDGGGLNGYAVGRGGALDFDSGSYDLEQSLASGTSRRDYLFRQLNVEIDDPVDRLIGGQLIDWADEAGYVTDDLAPLAANMGCDIERVERVLERLQRFDPPGMFARTLSECLALQLAERDRLDPAMEAFLDNLDLLAKRDLEGLIKACGVDREDIADMAAEIKALDPKPGLGFQEEIAATLIPDVFVRQSADGGWRIELNSDTLPRVLINERYCAEVSDRAKSKKDKAYITERLNSANWLVKSLNQRATTILRVSTELVRQQDGFFAHGVGHLRPLTLRDIAEAVEMHESTVSRVTSNKYMATPRGTFELKYFFTAAIASSTGGDSHSAEAVRHRIKNLIALEGGEVLSDDRLAEILSGDGIDIARRTVAKYREALRIPSSVERRRRMRQQI
jgi:RNA polymerase sigma-54 factor